MTFVKKYIPPVISKIEIKSDWAWIHIEGPKRWLDKITEMRKLQNGISEIGVFKPGKIDDAFAVFERELFEATALRVKYMKLDE